MPIREKMGIRSLVILDFARKRVIREDDPDFKATRRTVDAQIKSTRSEIDDLPATSASRRRQA